MYEKNFCRITLRIKHFKIILSIINKSVAWMISESERRVTDNLCKIEREFKHENSVFAGYV